MFEICDSDLKQLKNDIAFSEIDYLAAKKMVFEPRQGCSANCGSQCKTSSSASCSSDESCTAGVGGSHYTE